MASLLCMQHVSELLICEKGSFQSLEWHCRIHAVQTNAASHATSVNELHLSLFCFGIYSLKSVTGT